MIYRPLNVLPDNEYFAYKKPIKITWKNSGDIMKAYRIYIYNNATDSLEYDSSEIISYIPSHTLTQNLDVGTYKYKIIVYNDIASNSNRESAESIFKIFTVSPIPTVTLNLQDGDTISTQQLSISAEYSHPSGTKSKNYRFLLYDEYKTVIEESPYYTDDRFEYTYSTLLENKRTYFAQCMVITYDNIEAASDMVKFTAEYIKPNLNFKLAPTTYPCKPYVQLDWTISRIIGTIEGNGYYIDINGNALSSSGDDFYNNAVKLNVKSDGAKALFEEGFTIEGDFTINLWVEDIPTDGTIFFKLTNEDNYIMYLNFYQNRIHCWKENGLIRTHVVSDEIAYTGTEQIMIRIQQSENLYDVYTEIVE